MPGANVLVGLRIVGFIALAMIVVHVVNVLLNQSLMRYGIAPRSPGGWYQVFSAPFLHSGWQHLLNNLIAFSILSGLCLIRGAWFYLLASFLIIGISGGLVWLFARSAIHVGASGWIFGLWSLNISLAFFERSSLSWVLAVLVLFLYGGMAYGVLPADPRVSFEAHFFGAVSGVLVAFVYAQIKKHQQSNNSAFKK